MPRTPHTTLAAAAVAAAALACAALPAAAATPASVYDAPGQAHATRCLPLASPLAALRFGDGTPTGFSLTGGTTLDSDNCPAGSVRLDLHEVIPAAGGPLVFHRGGFGYDDRSNVKYGLLRTVDLSGQLPAPQPSSGGRGAPCDLAAEPPYRVSVQSIPAGMHYKRPQDLPGGSNSGASFLHYGDPGADQGDRTDIHYTYLTWSFLDVSGGGMVRTLLAPGQIVRACDVQPITMSAWDKKGNVDGWVMARYVRVLAGTCPLYGWMVWAHDFYGDDDQGTVAHAVTSDQPEPPSPTPDPNCPVAAPAQPPDAVTGDAALAPDGTWGLDGTVDPHGTPASFTFQVGLDRNYGTSTAAATVTAHDGPVAVAGRVGPLEPGEVYHYRVGALSAHGVSYGPDRTFTTPGTARPAARAASPAPVLSGLRVAPRAFHRARSRHGGRARIRFKLSAAAQVRLSFERRVRGRHGRVRWVAVRGSVRSQVRRGSARLRFGGWVGRRALARGSYRLRATPVTAAGRHGTARRVSFSLR